MGGWRRVVTVSLTIAALTAGCGSDGASSPTSSASIADTSSAPVATAAPPTTSTTPPTSSEPIGSTSTIAATTTTTTAPLSNDDGTCRDLPSSRTTPTVDESALSTFGRLGSSPSIELTLPAGNADAQPVVDVERIPGGMLFAIGTDADSSSASRVLAIDHDGTVRWQRCVPTGVSGVRVADAELLPADAVIAATTSDGGRRYQVLSLADGSISDAFAAVEPPSGWTRDEFLTAPTIGGDDRFVAISPDAMTDTVARVALIDLTDMAVVDVPDPPSAGSSYLELRAGGTLVQYLYGETQRPGPVAVLVDGTWRTDDASIVAALAPTVTYDYDVSGDEIPSLQLSDALGNVIWARPDVPTIMMEGFHDVIVDDVVVEVGCFETDEITGCARFVTGAYALATGETIWQQDGFGDVAASGDGLALMTTGADESGTWVWSIVDVHTGCTDRSRADVGRAVELRHRVLRRRRVPTCRAARRHRGDRERRRRACVPSCRAHDPDGARERLVIDAADVVGTTTAVPTSDEHEPPATEATIDQRGVSLPACSWR